MCFRVADGMSKETKRLTDPMPSISVNNEATILFSTSFWASSLFGQSASISSINIMDGRLNKNGK